MVTIHTLGGLSLRGVVGFDDATPDNRRAMALLALLAVAGERGVDRDRARELLGLPDRQEPDALTVTVDVIRNAAGPGAIRTDQALHVNLAVVRADVAEFERALDDRDARTAVALYTGPFLGGFSLADTPAFDQWVIRERERLERRLRSAQAMLALRNTPTGRTAGIPALKRPASATPRSETALDTAPRAAAQSRERGAIIGGRYRVLGELGRGAMAAVLLARDIKHERDVAIKFVRSDAADANALARFQREIALVAGLQHPHILPLYDSGESGGSLYYVMPYIAGQSLRERLDAGHALPLGEALRIAREAGDALAHAHAHGVIHRDVKPANILLSGGHALVGDFGIARGTPRAAGRRLTDDGFAVGTPAYMSPEQACGDPVDARSERVQSGVRALRNAGRDAALPRLPRPVRTRPTLPRRCRSVRREAPRHARARRAGRRHRPRPLAVRALRRRRRVPRRIREHVAGRTWPDAFLACAPVVRSLAACCRAGRGRRATRLMMVRRGLPRPPYLRRKNERNPSRPHGGHFFDWHMGVNSCIA